MHLTPDDIAEFKAIYKKEFGREISDAEAARDAQILVNLYEAMYITNPLPRERLLKLLQDEIDDDPEATMPGLA